MPIRSACAALAVLLLMTACRSETPPAPSDDGRIFGFAPVGPETFLTEPDPASLHGNLQELLDDGGPRALTQAYPNRWVQPPGWTATVEGFGEPTSGDLYAKRGYPYRTNLVDPGSGVVLLAYTKERPAQSVWAPQRTVRVSGRLEGYARKAPGVLILLDAAFGPTP